MERQPWDVVARRRHGIGNIVSRRTSNSFGSQRILEKGDAFSCCSWGRAQKRLILGGMKVGRMKWRQKRVKKRRTHYSSSIRYSIFPVFVPYFILELKSLWHRKIGYEKSRRGAKEKVAEDRRALCPRHWSVRPGHLPSIRYSLSLQIRQSRDNT